MLAGTSSVTQAPLRNGEGRLLTTQIFAYEAGLAELGVKLIRHCKSATGWCRLPFLGDSHRLAVIAVIFSHNDFPAHG